MRIVLVNRRDYPGSLPFDDNELTTLKDAVALLDSDPAASRAKLVPFMRERAREVYDMLLEFVANNDIPQANARANAGGIILGGWSFASAWMTAFLSYIGEFTVDGAELGKYVRRVILHGTPVSSGCFRER